MIFKSKINPYLNQFFVDNKKILNLIRILLWLSLIIFIYVTCFIPLYYIDHDIQVPFICLIVIKSVFVKIAKDYFTLTTLLLLYFIPFIITFSYFVIKPRLVNIKQKFIPFLKLLLVEILLIISFTSFVIILEKKILFYDNNANDNLLRLLSFSFSLVLLFTISLSIFLTIYLNIKYFKLKK